MKINYFSMNYICFEYLYDTTLFILLYIKDLLINYFIFKLFIFKYLQNKNHNDNYILNDYIHLAFISVYLFNNILLHYQLLNI